MPKVNYEDYGLILHENATNDYLTNVFTNKFKGLFDKVNAVWVTSDDDCNHYYMVEGLNENKETVEFFKVNQEDLINGGYSYMDVESTSFQQAEEYCYDYSIFPGCPVTSCTFGYSCKAPICGVKVYIGGEPYCQIS